MPFHASIFEDQKIKLVFQNKFKHAIVCSNKLQKGKLKLSPFSTINIMGYYKENELFVNIKNYIHGENVFFY